MTKKLTEMQKSALQEIGNIGAGHAALALSQLMGRRIMIAMPKINIAEPVQCLSEIGPRTPILGTHFHVLGDTEGEILFILEAASAGRLVDVLLQQPLGVTREWSSLEESTLKEAGLILSGSYINALASVMNMALIPSVPRVLSGAMEEVFQTVFERQLRESKILIGVETVFVEAETRIRGYFLYLPCASGLSALLNGLGVGHVSEEKAA